MKKSAKDEEDQSRTSAILQGLKEIAAYERGEISLRTTVISIPFPVDVLKLRKKLELSQKNFSLLYGIPLATLRNWEQGIRTPRGAHRILLALISSKPLWVAEEFKKIRERFSKKK